MSDKKLFKLHSRYLSHHHSRYQNFDQHWHKRTQ